MRVVAVRASLVDQDVLRRTAVAVTEPTSYHNGAPRAGGPMDVAMGVIDRSAVCRTCGQNAPTCQGHFGFVALPKPVMHPSHFAVKRALAVLRCVCWECAAVLVTDANRAAVERAQRLPVTRGARFAAVFASCSETKECAACGTQQPRVVRVGKGSWNFALETAGRRAPVGTERIYATLDRIDDAAALCLGFDVQFTHPRRLMFTALPIPPPHVRPAISLNASVVNQDDLTSTIGYIVKRAGLLKRQMTDGAAPVAMHVTEQLIAYSVHCLLDGSDVPAPSTGFNRSASVGKSVKAIRKRIEGKQGLVRQNLMGKRTDFTARTVITGDPHVSIRELGVPLTVANNLTFPERVTPHNVAQLTALAANGAESTIRNRGARFIVRGDTGDRQNLVICPSFQPLRTGDVVERQLRDGDVVIFNRQPSLHKMSIMAHKVRVMAHDTFRVNLSCTTPYNADFDGDEMNMHVPQTYEAMVEAATLMTPPTQIVSPQSNRPVMSIVQDSLLGAAILTGRDTFVEFDEACHLMLAARIERAVPVPAIVKPRPLWTGKQLFSMLLPPVHLRRFAALHPDDERTKVSPGDTRVVIDQGELLCGYTCKRTLGGVEGGLVHVTANDFGTEACADLIDGIQLLVTEWLAARPVSVGIRDFVIDAEARRQIRERLDAVQSLPRAAEDRTNDELNRARDEVGKIVARSVPRSNRMRLMTTVAGSKGSVLNLAQTIGCVGQQNVDGARIPLFLGSRCMPLFHAFDPRPAARGFVRSAYIDGLAPSEVFFHAMGGREGLIDTAVKTSETGYTQRRLVKVTESVTVSYSGAVVDASGSVVQFAYGDDGYDGARVEAATPVAMRLDRAAFQRHAAVAEGSETLAAYDELRRIAPRRVHMFCDIGRVMARAPKEEGQQAPQGHAALSALVESLSRRVRPIEALVLRTELTPGAVRGLSVSWIGATIERKLHLARAMPGEMVGSIAAQSVGEPATQMTLNTFHLAGVSCKNVTQGVPRLKEIINASANIRTPVLTVPARDEADAVRIKRALESTVASAILLRSEIVYDPCPETTCVEEDAELVAAYVDLGETAPVTASPWVVRLVFDSAALAHRGARLSDVVGPLCALVPNSATTYVADDNADLCVVRVRLASGDHAHAAQLAAQLETAHVLGIPGITGASVEEPRGTSPWVVYTEGTNLVGVAAIDGVDASAVYSNDVMEVHSVLGVEAARAALVRELRAVLEADGSYVNIRHINLLCDVMTHRGDVAAFTRHGLARSDAGFLARCSFEETVEVLHNAATFGDREVVSGRGVTSNILLGQLAPVGTGSFSLALDTSALDATAMDTTPVDAGYVPSTPERPAERQAERQVEPQVERQLESAERPLQAERPAERPQSDERRARYRPSTPDLVYTPSTPTGPRGRNAGYEPSTP
jgi:DNA-directed RNA polymerase II subunit RPB1